MPLTRATRPRAPRSPSLDHPDPVQRRLAVADCIQAEALLTRLDAEGDAAVRHAILTRLGAMPEAGLEGRLIQLLASRDVALRQDAILALRRRGDAALPALETLLAGPDAGQRIIAANVLEGCSGSRPRAALAARLAAEEDAAVCLALVEALAQIGTPEEVPALRALHARFREEPCLSFAISFALDEVGAEA
jgi:HEAT repeat protein